MVPNPEASGDNKAMKLTAHHPNICSYLPTRA
jgi:hypothetical protein